jgi:hypothetical protein
MNIYASQTLDPIFDSLKDVIIDWSQTEPLEFHSPLAPKLFGEHNGMFGKTHTLEAKAKISKANEGKICAKDINGNIIKISKSDPRWLSGELVGVNKNKQIKLRKIYTLISPSNSYELDFHGMSKLAKMEKLCLASLYATINSNKTTKQGWRLEVRNII